MFSQQQNDSTIVLLIILKNLKKRNFLKMRKNLPFETFQAFCVFSCRLDMFVTTPAPQFDKNCTQLLFFSKKVDFSIFEPKLCEEEQNCCEAPLNFRLLKCTNFGRN